MDSQLKRYYSAVILLGLLLVGGLWLVVWQQVEYERNKTLAQSSREAMNLAKAFEENVRSIVADLDEDLVAIKRAYEKDGPSSPVIAAILEHTRKDFSRVEVGIADEQGRFIVSSDENVLGMDFSDRAWFIQPRDNMADSLYINQTVASKISGKGVIPVSRRINKPDGSFGGAIHIGLDTGYFENVFTRLDLGPGGVMMLTGLDGIIRVRQSQDSLDYGQDIRKGGLWMNVRRKPANSIIVRSTVDNVDRLLTYRVLTGYPLFIVVGSSLETVLGLFEKRRNYYIGGAAGVSCVILIACILLLDRFRRQRKETLLLRRNAEVQAGLKKIAEAAMIAPSLDEFYESVHRLVEQLFPAKNFSIAILNEATEEIVIPFGVDNANLLAERRPVGKGMTEYIMKLGQAAYVTPAKMDRLRETGEYALAKSHPVKICHYLGAPLINSQGNPFGVISLVLTQETQAFQPDDVEILSAIALQVSLAIERKQSEEARQESEQKNRTILQTTSDGFWLVGNDGRILEVNEAACTMMGYSYNEFQGMDIGNMPIQESAEETAARILRIRKNGSEIFETSLVRKDGSVFDGEVLVTLLPNSGGQMVGFCRDITERKQAMENLRDTSEHLSKLIYYANALIVVWNPEFIITRFNEAFEELSGYAAEEVIGSHVSILFSEESWTETLEMMELSRSGMQWKAVEIPVRCKSGEMKTVLWNFANIYRADETTLTAVIAQGQDITERVRREQEIHRDTQLATRVQNALLSVPAMSEYLDIDTVYQPLGYVGGDMYFMDWRFNGSLLRGFLVDAAGHGLGTALHTASLHVLLREVNERDLPLSDTICWLNRRVGEYFNEATFAGALGFEIDLAIRQLRWVCAGIPKTWVSTKSTQGMLECPGMCLGIDEDERFETHTMQITVGDSFYFMTHGLADLLEGNAELPLNQFDEMVELLQTVSKNKDRRDDASAVCLHVKSLPQLLVRQDGWPRIIRFNGYGDYQRLKGEVAKILAEVTGQPHSLQEVAVHEALANAMECRDGVPRQHKARLRFNKVGNRLIVRVKTSRMGFAGNAILRRLRSQPEDMFSFGEDASMGRGIPMMLSIAHKMTYNSEGTEVLLAWKL